MEVAPLAVPILASTLEVARSTLRTTPFTWRTQTEPDPMPMATGRPMLAGQLGAKTRVDLHDRPFVHRAGGHRKAEPTARV